MALTQLLTRVLLTGASGLVRDNHCTGFCRYNLSLLAYENLHCQPSHVLACVGCCGFGCNSTACKGSLYDAMLDLAHSFIHLQF